MQRNYLVVAPLLFSTSLVEVKNAEIKGVFRQKNNQQTLQGPHIFFTAINYEALSPGRTFFAGLKINFAQ